MAKLATGEKWKRLTVDVCTKRVRLCGTKHTIKMLHCKTDAAADSRAAILAELAHRMTLANTEPELGLDGLQRVGRADAGLKLKGACEHVDDLIGGWRPDSTCPTFGAVFERWQSNELATLYPDHVAMRKASTTIRAAQATYDKYIRPVLHDVPVDRIVIDDLKKIRASVAHLPQQGSRRQAQQPLKTVLDICVQPLELIDRTPMPAGWLPSGKRTRELQWLRPGEDALLLGCTLIPLCWRVLWGFYIRNGAREEEALAMALSQFVLGPKPSAELYKSQVKTRKGRLWSLDRTGTAEGLRRWVAIARASAQPGERMFVNEIGARIVAKTIDLPALLREHLQLAGITRPALFASDTTARNIVVHDLRATCVTVRVAAGWSDSEVAQVTGHLDRKELENYKRDAETLDDIQAGDFVPLHLAIPELAAAPASPYAPAAATQPAAPTALHLVAMPAVQAPHARPGHSLASRSANDAEPLQTPCSIVESRGHFQGTDMIENAIVPHPAQQPGPVQSAQDGHVLATPAARLAALEGQVAVLLHLVERQPAALVAQLADGLAHQVTTSVLAALAEQGVVQRPRPQLAAATKRRGK